MLEGISMKNTKDEHLNIRHVLGVTAIDTLATPVTFTDAFVEDMSVVGVSLIYLSSSQS